MVKTIFLAIAALLPTICLTGCNDEADLTSTKNVSNDKKIGLVIRPIDDAVDIAEQAAEAFGIPQVGSRVSQDDIASRVHVIGNPQSRSDVSCDTLLYAIDYGNGNGFALVSAIYGTEAFIGIVESGNFDDSETIMNDGFQYYLNAATEYAASGIGIGDGSSFELTPYYYTISRPVYDFIEPKVKVEWGQRYPEGYFCPNKISGCVQTAMAQIFSYFEEPSTINLTYPEKDKTSVTLNWTELKKHKTSPNTYATTSITTHLNSCETSEDTHLDLGRLCRELGYRNKAEYETNQTGAYSHYARTNFASILNNHQVSQLTNTDNSGEDIYELIKQDYILYIQGSDIDKDACHAFIADGGKSVGTITYYYIKDPDTGKDTLLRVVDNAPKYIHFNWGWNGNSNGYFLAGVFDTTNAHEWDNSSSYSGYNFSHDIYYISIK